MLQYVFHENDKLKDNVRPTLQYLIEYTTKRRILVSLIRFFHDLECPYYAFCYQSHA